ncbi:uncharacterized protein LOC131859364 [Cryptomeria japonica]|uniref:uncharacterized protein LOC131859364 n=1 Tax=Cryptomeria japonica TaxID=3369 RepID=UPI0027DA1034|nr:uncharacterized protein LOC131859364 [Cryptomeria japonica]
MKLDVPMYGGKMDNEDVLDWIDALDNYFDFKEVLEDQKMNLAKTKLKGSTLTWWNCTQSDKMRRGKLKINNWDKMVAKVKAQFLLGDYEVQNFKRLQNLKQKEMDVMTYIEEFHKLSLRVGHHEDEVEKIARYVNGLRHSIQDELSLTTPRSAEECFQLATRAKEKIKRRQEQQAKCRERRTQIIHEEEAKSVNSPSLQATPETGEALLMRKTLIKVPTIKEPPQRKSLFRTTCKVQGKVCKVVVDFDSTDNLFVVEMVEKLKLKRIPHTTPYKVSWLKKGHQVLANEQFWVEFKIGAYEDKILCDIILMDVCHILLGRPWQYDREAQHDGQKNVYVIKKGGVSFTLTPLKEDGSAVHEGPSAMVVKEMQFMKNLEEEDCGYAIVGKPISEATNNDNKEVPKEVQTLLDKYEGIVVKELPNSLPPIRDVSHHIDLIPSASLPNKATYKMIPQQNEIKNQVQELLDKGFVRKCLSPCDVPTVLAPKTDGDWRLSTDLRATNKITIRYRFPIPQMENLMDSLAGARTKEDHLRHLDMVLGRLDEEKLMINLKKCEWMKEELAEVLAVTRAQAKMASYPDPRIEMERVREARAKITKEMTAQERNSGEATSTSQTKGEENILRQNLQMEVPMRFQDLLETMPHLKMAILNVVPTQSYQAKKAEISIVDPMLLVVNSGRHPAVVEMGILGTTLMDTFVDGGSGVNVLPEEKWKKLGNPTLWPPTFNLLGEDQHGIKLLGTLMAQHVMIDT